MNPSFGSSFRSLYVLEAQNGGAQLGIAFVALFIITAASSAFSHADGSYNFVPPALLMIFVPNLWGVIAGYFSFASEYTTMRHHLLRALPCPSAVVVLAKFAWVFSSVSLMLLCIVLSIHLTHPPEAKAYFTHPTAGLWCWLNVLCCWIFAGGVGIAAAILGKGAANRGSLVAGGTLLIGALVFLTLIREASLKPSPIPMFPVPSVMFRGEMPVFFPVVSLILLTAFLGIASFSFDRQDA